MRKTHHISVERITEAFEMTRDGWIVLRLANGVEAAGEVPSTQRRGNHFYTKLDRRSVKMVDIAWVLMRGCYPNFRLRQRLPSSFDFNLDNLCGGNLK